MLSLKNPFIFAPIKTGYSDGNGRITEKHFAFYSRRAKYLGAITPEPFYLDKGLREIPTQLGIDNDDKIEGLKKLTGIIHQFNTKVIAHLSHPGRMANPKIPGNYYVSATHMPCENGGATPQKMDIDDIKKAVGLFVNAAIRAEKSGFDGIELQFGHGYLPAQFISPFVNNRNDEYGGSFENRIKFSLEILRALKEVTNIPVIIRISGDEMIPEGIKLPEMIDFSKILEKKGVQAIHVSAGSVCSTPPWYFQHMFIEKGKIWEFAKAIKNNVDIPVIFVGRINKTDDIERIKNDYAADYIAIGRALVADPDFIGKYLAKVKGQIRPCLACEQGCLGGVRAGQGLKCLVNPEVGKETEALKPAQTIKKCAVIGGGLAGMQACITLKRRGHMVDLYEKDKLGGQFNLAHLTPHKKSMARLVPYFINELKTNKINTIFKEVTNSDMLSKYDCVVLATGSKPAVPRIEGLDKYYWADIMLEKNLPSDKKVLIIGGGLVGVDIATALIPRNNQIIIAELLADFARDMEMIAREISLRQMNEKKVIFSDHTNIKRIDGKTVYAERNNELIQFDNIDIIVISVGTQSYTPLKNELNNSVPVYVIGDAKNIGNAQGAISDGYESAKEI
ncbi:MAG: FAD-dependent oxidoreductase [Bacteroidales bacterium]|nr:FAD-dependent oxidoreductase [Bacteroidales bacterium]